MSLETFFAKRLLTKIQNKMNSKIFSLHISDFAKGLIVAIITALISGCMTSLNKGTLPDLADLKAIAITALAAGLAYLSKNLLSNSEGKFLKSEPEPNDGPVK